MKVIAIANQKGGCGKTTTAVALATGLNSKGHKALLIDIDSQCNATDNFKAQTKEQTTLYDVFADGTALSDAVQHTEYGDIIASDKLLKKADRMFIETNDVFILKEAIEKIQSDYEYCVIDTPPGLGILQSNALAAADEIIIPITSRYSVQGLAEVNATVTACRKYINPTLKIAGIILTIYNPNTVAGKNTKQAIQKIAEQLNTKLFDTTIRTTTKVKESEDIRTPLLKYAPYSTAAIDYKNFINEYLEEINNG